MHRFAVPVESFDELPTVTLVLNAKWASFVDGALSPLLDRRTWDGTEAEIDHAIEQIQLILGALGGA